MADGGCNDIAEDDVAELEAMCKDSFSWRPCQVSLCSRGLGLTVIYGNNNLQEMITDKEEIFARIRVRSTPLQGGDCLSIRQGQHVLATKSSHVTGVFYDARVEEAIHVRHSKRIHCRCSFTIKWLHQALEEEALTVPASAIMKIASKSIHLHPTISTFFIMLESSNGLDAMPCSTIVDRMNWETDINVLLEKQIKEISHSTDISQEKISKDFGCEQEVDLKGQSHGREIDASLKDPHVAVPLLNKLKDSNGSENKQPMQTVLELPPAFIPSIQEEFTGSRLLLSPLAARAALASLRSEFPQSLELSAQSNVEKGDIAGEHSTGDVLYGSKCYSFSAADHSSNTEDLSLKISATLGGRSPNFDCISATLGGRSPNFDCIVKTLFPTSSAPQIVEFSNLSSGAQIDGMEKKRDIGEEIITQPSESRLTRTKIQRINGMHETTQMTNTMKTRRITRSTVKGAGKIEIKEHNAAVEDNARTECIKLDASSQNIVASQYCLSDNQKVAASTINGETSIRSDEDDKSLLGKDGIVVKVDVQKEAFIRKNAEKQIYPKRLTRSAAREEAEKNKVQPNLKVRKSSFAESNELDLFKGNVSAKSNRLKLEKSLTSPLATNSSEQVKEEREKNSTSTHAKKTPKSSEEGLGGHQSTRQKSASSKKQETRFSHRLRFLPRTRSQTKA